MVLIVLVYQPGMTMPQRMRTAMLYGVVLMVAALLLRRPWGINKIAATPAWGLWSSAFTCWAWLVFHAINDRLGWTRGWGLLRDLGRNALLAYLLPPLFYAVMEIAAIDERWWDVGERGAAIGIGRAVALATIIGVIVALLYRRRVRIRI
jgi:hypothetical protein